MTTDEKIKMLKIAFQKAIELAGNVHQLHLKTGVSEASLNRYNSGKQDISNAPFSTLVQLFPCMTVDYFGISCNQGQALTSNNVESELERKVLDHFRSLTPSKKADYIMIVAANFPENIVTETKR